MADLPRLCVFGDSHYACVRQAEVQGLVDVRGVALEYWGHVGSRFRHLEVRDGTIHPLDEFTAQRFAKFNALGRTFLPAADFDAILVAGARVYVWRMFHRLLQRLSEGPFVSQGLQQRILTDSLRGQAGYRLAAGLAATGTARVLLAPVAYYTASPERFAATITPQMAAILQDKLPGFWAVLAETAARDGIELIPQPQETVVDGLFTDPAYAVQGHIEKQDYEHHNAAYGAVILAQALERLQGGEQALRPVIAPGKIPARTEA
ncbi:hypothetical protein [Tabrizicola sp.]|uniref:hypothetical protein n=1 Tax=Tabrizicola sp. TaxID=2005166 RepID=UPI002735705B|nr:hypothetical protein [Tabrizicola sp.]MDP3193941.1 hypothetical protein [Tabrizicola sp.]